MWDAGGGLQLGFRLHCFLVLQQFSGQAPTSSPSSAPLEVRPRRAQSRLITLLLKVTQPLGSRAGLPRGLPENLELPGCFMAPCFCYQGNGCLFACFSLSYFNNSYNKPKVQAEIENKDSLRSGIPQSSNQLSQKVTTQESTSSHCDQPPFMDDQGKVQRLEICVTCQPFGPGWARWSPEP